VVIVDVVVGRVVVLGRVGLGVVGEVTNTVGAVVGFSLIPESYPVVRVIGGGVTGALGR